MRQNKICIFLMLFIFIIIVTPAYKAFAEGLELTAFSFRIAEQMLQSNNSGDSIPVINSLGYINRPLAIIADKRNNDIILLGKTDKTFPLLTLDDFVADLRCVFFYGERPGVTIDPKGKGDSQEVRYFCGIENTHFGEICFESDYLLKKIAFNKYVVSAPIKPYFQLAIDRFKKNPSLTWNIITKFEFYPINCEARYSDNISYLPKCSLGVIPRTLFAEENGRIIKDLTAYNDIPATEFTQSFSYMFTDITKRERIFANLQNLTELHALLVGLARISDLPELSYWFTSYQVQDSRTPYVVDVLTTTSGDTRRRMTLSGGVQLATIPYRIKKGIMSSLADATLVARPSSDILTWAFTIQKDFNLKIPSLTEEERNLAMLFSEGLSLYEMGNYSTALERFDKVVSINPDISEAWLARGMILRAWGLSTFNEGNIAKAIGCFNKAISIRPSFISAHYELGKTLHAIGMTNESIKEFKKAIEIRADYWPSYYGLGLALKAKGDFPGAITAFEKYLKYDRNKERTDETKNLILELKGKEKLSEKAHNADNKSYSNSQNKFTCECPKDWLILSRNELIQKGKGRFNPPEDLVVAFVSQDNFDDNVNIQVAQVGEENLSDKDIEDTIKEFDKVYPKNYPDFKKIRAGALTASGAKGLEYTYSSTRLGVPLQQRVIIFVKAKRAYTITFTALKDNFEKLDNTTFQPVLESFRIQ